MRIVMLKLSLLRRWFLLAGFLAVLGGLPACTRSLTAGGPTEIPYATFASVPVEGFTTPVPTQAEAGATPGAPGALVDSTPRPLPNLSLTPSSPGAAIVYPHRLAVFNLAEGEVLNVRSTPSVSGEIVATLDAGTRQLEPTGKTETADEFTWVEIHLPDPQAAGQTGWVSGAFVVEEVPAEAFCADPKVGALLDQFVMAVRAEDGGALAALVSPTHGLSINRAPGSAEIVTISDPGETAGLFRSSFEYVWGADSASGQSVIGSFKTVLLPELVDVLGGSSTRYCNSLQTGQGIGATSAQIAWPYDYTAVNFVALHRPAPETEEMNWRTWAVGVDYVENTPYISLLLEYYWTP